MSSSVKSELIFKMIHCDVSIIAIRLKALWNVKLCECVFEYKKKKNEF